MSAPPPSKSEGERLDREHEELFHELRAVIPGAEVLFAFLLTVAFTERFRQLSDGQKGLYLATFLLSAASLVLLLAPTAFHRVRFRQMDKAAMIRLANREVIVAMSIMSVAIASASALITGMVSARSWAPWLVGLVVWASAAVLWWLVPLRRRLQGAGATASPSDADGPGAGTR